MIHYPPSFLALVFLILSVLLSLHFTNGPSYSKLLPKCELCSSFSSPVSSNHSLASLSQQVTGYKFSPISSNSETSISSLKKTHYSCGWYQCLFHKEGLDGLRLSRCPGPSSFSLGLWVTELTSSKDSLVPKSLLNPKRQTKITAVAF